VLPSPSVFALASTLVLPVAATRTLERPVSARHLGVFY